MCTKGELGVVLSAINVPLIVITQSKYRVGEEKEKDKSFIFTQLEIHKMLYKKNCL